MKRKYFGTDGVRGKVGGEVINAEFALRLGYAAGKVLAKEHSARRGRPTVLIGKDTRISGYMLESALEAGFASAGIEVLLAGPLPTPAVAYLTRTWRLVAGIVISASHNPYDDNGIKFFAYGGVKLPDEAEDRIEEHLGIEKLLPTGSEERRQRQYFAALRQLFELLNRGGAHLDTLSMGMSADYPAAIREGATLVRVGTALFGSRAAAERAGA